VILIPAYNGITCECQMGVDILCRAGYRVLVERCNADIALARSRLASTALRLGYKHFLWIDSDMCFDPDVVEPLLKSAHELIGGAYVKEGAACFCASHL
jgi:hypothetical protein